MANPENDVQFEPESATGFETRPVLKAAIVREYGQLMVVTLGGYGNTTDGRGQVYTGCGGCGGSCC